MEFSFNELISICFLKLHANGFVNVEAEQKSWTYKLSGSHFTERPQWICCNYITKWLSTHTREITGGDQNSRDAQDLLIFFTHSAHRSHGVKVTALVSFIKKPLSQYNTHLLFSHCRNVELACLGPNTASMVTVQWVRRSLSWGQSVRQQTEDRQTVKVVWELLQTSCDSSCRSLSSSLASHAAEPLCPTMWHAF